MKTITTVILSLMALVTTTFAQSRLQNLSTRGYVGTGDFVLIAGGIITGTQSKTIIVRAIGPSLARYGLGNVALLDPVLEIYDSNGTMIASNDDWQDDAFAYQLADYGLEPPDPYESAIIGFVPPGSYTALVRGFGDTEGVALVEIYDVD